MENSTDALPVAIGFQSELRYMAKEAEKSPTLEIGGDLFGYWTHSGIPVVHVATGAGPHASRTTTHYSQDLEYLQRIGQELNDGYALQHIGAWHSHHYLGLNTPSEGDVQTAHQILDDTGFAGFLLVICNLNRICSDVSISLRAYCFRRSEMSSPLSTWIELPVNSPIGLAFRGECKRHGTPHYVLEPSSGSMNSLRGSTAAVFNRFGVDCLPSDFDQERVLEEYRRLKTEGVPVEVSLPNADNLVFSVKTEKTWIHLILSSDFPGKPPAVWIHDIAHSEPVPLDLYTVLNRPWSAENSLLRLYRAVTIRSDTSQGLDSISNTDPDCNQPEGIHGKCL